MVRRGGQRFKGDPQPEARSGTPHRLEAAGPEAHYRYAGGEERITEAHRRLRSEAAGPDAGQGNCIFPYSPAPGNPAFGSEAQARRGEGWGGGRSQLFEPLAQVTESGHFPPFIAATSPRSDSIESRIS
jgi:hypothetical protein